MRHVRDTWVPETCNDGACQERRSLVHPCWARVFYRSAVAWVGPQARLTMSNRPRRRAQDGNGGEAQGGPVDAAEAAKPQSTHVPGRAAAVTCGRLHRAAAPAAAASLLLVLLLQPVAQMEACPPTLPALACPPPPTGPSCDASSILYGSPASERASDHARPPPPAAATNTCLLLLSLATATPRCGLHGFACLGPCSTHRPQRTFNLGDRDSNSSSCSSAGRGKVHLDANHSRPDDLHHWWHSRHSPRLILVAHFWCRISVLSPLPSPLPSRPLLSHPVCLWPHHPPPTSLPARRLSQGQGEVAWWAGIRCDNNTPDSSFRLPEAVGVGGPGTRTFSSTKLDVH